MTRRRLFRGFICAWLVWFSLGTRAAELSDHAEIRCVRPEPLGVECQYRFFAPAQLHQATARTDDLTLPVRQEAAIQNTEPNVAVLVLVDTSDPRRGPVIAENRAQISAFADQASTNTIFALARFDAEIEVLCGFPCNAAAMQAAASRLTADGITTELYRNTIAAIKILDATTADHKLLLLMSDGLAEDLAYFHDDVVAAARTAGVVISSIGYARTAGQSVALQTLRRLSEETGGLFTAADPIDYSLAPDYFATALNALTSGGLLHIDLQPAHAAGLERSADIRMTMTSSLGVSHFGYRAALPIRQPPPAASPEPPSAPAPSPVTAESTMLPRAPVPHSDAEGGPYTAFWYALPTGIFSAILAVSLGYALMSRYQNTPESIGSGDQHAPHAFMVSTDSDALRHRIAHTPWRIGRSRNNELPLNDTSVSRLHAEIRRDALGQFTIQDLSSLNGVFVNGEAVDLAHLNEGDRVEVGDVGFMFTLHDEDYARQDATVLVRTRTPV